MIRDQLGMKAGDRMTLTLMPDGIVVMRVKNKHVADLAGLLHKKGRKAVPLELLSR
jgi:antitoxin PrlF